MGGLLAGNSVELPIAPEQRFSLRVEAVGYMPSDQQTIRLAPAERRRQLRVALEPAQRATGVTFEVRGPDLDPVTALRVRALRRKLDASADTPFERAWERSTRSADGSYRLPDLAPGSYRFELQAVDACAEIGNPLATGGAAGRPRAAALQIPHLALELAELRDGDASRCRKKHRQYEHDR